MTFQKSFLPQRCSCLRMIQSFSKLSPHLRRNNSNLTQTKSQIAWCKKWNLSMKKQVVLEETSRSIPHAYRWNPRTNSRISGYLYQIHYTGPNTIFDIIMLKSLWGSKPLILEGLLQATMLKKKRNLCIAI